MSLPSSCGCPGCAVVLDWAQSRRSRGVATMTTRGCTRRWFVGRVDRDGSREAVATLSIQYSQRKASRPQTQPCFTPCTCLALRSSLSTRSCATATIASVPHVKPPSMRPQGPRHVPVLCNVKPRANVLRHVVSKQQNSRCMASGCTASARGWHRRQHQVLTAESRKH
jgi:hypothetical protein